MIDDQDEDEHTSFDPKPWGAQQRVLPRRGFKAAKTGIALSPLPGLPPREPAPRKKFVETEPKTHVLGLGDIEELAPPPNRVATGAVVKLSADQLSSDDPPDVLPAEPRPIRRTRADATPLAPPPPPRADATPPPSRADATPVPSISRGGACGFSRRASLGARDPSYIRIATAWPVKPVSFVDRISRFALPIAAVFVIAVLSIAYLQPDKRASAAVATTASEAPRVRMAPKPTVTPIKSITVTPIVEELPKPEPTITDEPKEESKAAKPARQAKSRKRRPVVVNTSTPLGDLRVAKF
jgi:hypothetical protein